VTSDQAPFLSVIVPTLNAGNQLKSCLEALEKSGYRDFEVIVADDGSDSPRERLRQGFRYLRAAEAGQPKGPALARNLAPASRAVE
jgi:glycosyltransferase involved in cell wall biosynthesis